MKKTACLGAAITMLNACVAIEQDDPGLMSSSHQQASSASAHSSSPALSSAQSSSLQHISSLHSSSSMQSSVPQPPKMMTRDGYTVEEMNHCKPNNHAANNELLIGNNHISLFGYSHVLSGEVYEKLSLPKESPLYDARAFTFENSESCSGALTLTKILLKKYSDTNHQHSNGFSKPISIAYNNIKEIVFELKINSVNTHIATQSELAGAYGHIINNTEQLDRGNAAFTIRLADDKDGPKNKALIAQKYIEIKPTEFDTWMKVTIPFESMDFINYVNYSGNITNINDSQGKTAVKLLFSPETRGSGNNPLTFGRVVKNFNKQLWTSNPPQEIFKETSITLKTFEIVLKP